MKMNKLFFVALFMIAFSSCEKRISEIPVLDVTKSYPSKNVILQDIADVTYIPLETKEGFLISESLPIQYMDEEILVTNNREEIMFFNSKTGKAINSFNRSGRGPGEYIGGIHSIAVDKEKNELFVTLNTSSYNKKPIYVYDLQGNHLRTLEFQNIDFPQFFYNYNEKYLFWYNSDVEDPHPYKLISKTDTTFTYLPIVFTERDNMSVTQKDDYGSTTYFRNGGAILKTYDGYILSEAGIDTMFHWNKHNGKLTPVMVRTPSFKSMTVPIGAFITGQCSEYIFLNTIERKFDFETNRGFKTVRLLYDKNSGQFYEGAVLNSDYVSNLEVNISNSISVGQCVVSFQAWQLVSSYKKGRLRGRLEEIAAKLVEDDNPVLMVVTFK